MPSEIVDLFNKQITTVIVSSISKEGYPHALPVHLVTAKDNKTLHLALAKAHKTVENIKLNENVFITVVDGNDTALGIRGKAKVIKEPMDGNIAVCMLEVKVEEIKSDTSPTAAVASGIAIKPRNERSEQFVRVMFSELKG